MVKLDLDSSDGADISIWLKITIFLVLFALMGLGIELYRRYPFIAFYLYSLLILALPATIYSAPISLSVKACLSAFPFFTISLWRLSCITEEVFTDHFIASFPLNYAVYRQLKGKFSQDILEWLCAASLFGNILWTTAIDISVGSYFNASCGLILATTIPLPSTMGWNAPGYSVEGEEAKVDFVVPDLHWCWTMLYTSWNILFWWMYSLNLYTTMLHTIPCYVYCAVMQRWDLYVMLRTFNLYVVIQIISPWKWPDKALGQPVIIESEFLALCWGGCHLGAALLYLMYHGWIWRKRVYAESTKEETQLDEVVAVAGSGHTPPDKNGAAQKSISYGEDSEYIVYK